MAISRYSHFTAVSFQSRSKQFVSRFEIERAATRRFDDRGRAWSPSYQSNRRSPINVTTPGNQLSLAYRQARAARIPRDRCRAARGRHRRWSKSGVQSDIGVMLDEVVYRCRRRHVGLCNGRCEPLSRPICHQRGTSAPFIWTKLIIKDPITAAIIAVASKWLAFFTHQIAKVPSLS